MDSPRDHPPYKLNSFSSLLFFCKKDPQQQKRPPLHLPTSASLLLEPPGLKTLTSPLNLNRSLTCIKPNLFSSSASSLYSLSSSSPSFLSSSYSAMDDVKSSSQEKERLGDENENSRRQNGEAEEKKEILHERGPSCCTSKRIYLHQQPSCHRRTRSSSSSGDETREFPPPIPLLARTGNLPCHMPWVLKRIRDNGRLVIQEVKVKHHEFFRAHRANGRLTLQLMHLDDSLLDPHPRKQEQENETTPDEEAKQQQEKMEKDPQEETSIANDHKHHHNQSLLASPKEKSIEEHNPSPPSSRSPSMSGPRLSKSTATATANLDKGPLQEKSSLWEMKNMNMPDVSEIGPLPSKLSPSLPESPFVIGGSGGGCSASRRSDSLFQMPVPAIRPILS